MIVALSRKRQLVDTALCFRPRLFSVKALSWCEPTDSPVRRNKGSTLKPREKTEKKELNPIEKFGVVAAMSKNRVIGIDGGIPWRLPEDRKIFKNLTRERILIIGRNTFDEHPNLVHVDHTKHCIVVSGSMDNIKDFPVDAPISLHLVRSLPQALELAREIFESKQDAFSGDDLSCWIAGGEKIYEEALKHRCVDQVHLSIVDCEVEYSNADHVAMFPAKYRWDHKFDLPCCTRFPASDGAPGFEYFVYQKKQKHK